MLVVKENLIQIKTFAFAKSIIILYKDLKSKNEFTVSRQLLRSGTSIGANVEEAIAAASKKDFTNKMNIALKEARETKYWLRLFEETELVKANFSDLKNEADSIVNVLTKIVKTSRENALT